MATFLKEVVRSGKYGSSKEIVLERVRLLKNQILLRKFADWNEKRVGFIEFDLVSHDSGNIRGDYIQTLDGN